MSGQLRLEPRRLRLSKYVHATSLETNGARPVCNYQPAGAMNKWRFVAALAASVAGEADIAMRGYGS